MNQSFSLLNLFPIIFFVLKSTLLININTIFLLINVGWSIFYYSLRISVYLHLAFFFFFFFCKQHMLSLVLLIWHIFSLLRFNVIIITLLIQSIQVYKLAVCTNYHLFLYFPALRGSCLKKRTFRSLHNIYFRHTVLSFDK